MLDNQYRVTSNRESGEGRYDIQLCPYNKKLPGVLIELKAGKDCSDEQLQELAETALKQINDRKYEVDMTVMNVEKSVQIRCGILWKECPDCNGINR